MARVAMLAILVVVALAGCSRAPSPTKPAETNHAKPAKKPALEADLVCFVLDSLLGFGMVCAERPGPCKYIQQKTAESRDVSAISECRKARVTVEAK